ncbi:TIGR04282 family arsenosugar biosynthesis glycosyltransferase [Neptunomonas sp.]|uniref:TIGR04282 family arsenosugar biosynthesis glycosyltransferase n=1 Tax=Neptunomonas sp. TaxID=1971898 RepID=UPI00356AB8A3
MSTALIIFAKAPVAGMAKTRLIPALGAEGAAKLHGLLLEHTIQRAVASACFPIYLFTPENNAHPLIDHLLISYPLIHRVQKGVDLGERMENALLSVLSENQSGALLIGSDCPAIDADILERCCLSLESHDAVFIPAADGGYTLVGLQFYDSVLSTGASVEASVEASFGGIFENIEWGSDRVMQQTRSQLQALSFRWHEPLTLWDVDRPEDLVKLCQQFPYLCGGLSLRADKS